jgi:hypothetical protein
MELAKHPAFTQAVVVLEITETLVAYLIELKVEVRTPLNMILACNNVQALPATPTTTVALLQEDGDAGKDGAAAEDGEEGDDNEEDFELDKTPSRKRKAAVPRHKVSFYATDKAQDDADTRQKGAARKSKAKHGKDDENQDSAGDKLIEEIEDVTVKEAADAGGGKGPQTPQPAKVSEPPKTPRTMKAPATTKQSIQQTTELINALVDRVVTGFEGEDPLADSDIDEDDDDDAEPEQGHVVGYTPKKKGKKVTYRPISRDDAVTMANHLIQAIDVPGGQQLLSIMAAQSSDADPGASARMALAAQYVANPVAKACLEEYTNVLHYEDTKDKLYRDFMLQVSRANLAKTYKALKAAVDYLDSTYDPDLRDSMIAYMPDGKLKAGQGGATIVRNYIAAISLTPLKDVKMKIDHSTPMGEITQALGGIGILYTFPINTNKV